MKDCPLNININQPAYHQAFDRRRRSSEEQIEESGEFSVCQFIDDGKGGEMSEYVGQRLGPKDAVDLAHSYCNRPAAKIGIIKRVIITDADDYCCFEWQHGKGVTFK